MEAQILLKRGARWRLGDGSSIPVLEQPWLADMQNPCITTQNAALQGLTVNSLFKTGTREWDEDILRDMVNDRDREAIQSIVLCRNQYIDTRYWCYEQNGQYTVKSAYKMLQRNLGRWTEDEENKIWRGLWKLQIPEKVKVFLWRALNGCLPTKCNLRTRSIETDEVCPFCRVDKETTAHCFIHCIFARSCWDVVCPEVNVDNLLTFNGWFTYVFDNLKERMDKISLVCWGIWRARNDVVWNNKLARKETVVTNAITYLTQWKEVQKLEKTVTPTPVLSTGSTERWSKPDDGCVKVNCDATIFTGSQQFGVGWIARDDKGDLICAKSVCLSGCPEIHHAEAIGIWEALSWIKLQIDSLAEDSGYSMPKKFTVESDCVVAVNAVLKKEKIYSPFGSVVDDCRSILRYYNNIDIVCVKRSGNRAADLLARWSSSTPGCIVRGEHVPPDLNCILEDDLK